MDSHGGSYKAFLTPERIDFLSWENPDYHHNDYYAYFIICHFNKIGKHFPNLFEITKERASQGNTDAKYNFGIMYGQGYGVEKDEKEAFKYYKLAADQGHIMAQVSLGIMYQNGIGIEKDEKVAFKYYKLAADQGHIMAQSTLGMMYEAGIGVEKDEKEAFKYYKLAADQGQADAQLTLGIMYQNGIGVKKDEKEAFKYYKLAADQGQADAQLTLGIMYQNGIGVEKDEKEAFRYYKLSADKGYINAQYVLGVMYEEGIGVEKDEKEAFKYYKLAADKGHIDAQFSLGVLYSWSIELEKDVKEAFKYCKLAADKGHIGAQLGLGSFYANGIGVEKNAIEALHWYIKSKDQSAEAFIHKHLLLTPNSSIVGDAFKKILVEFMTVNNPDIHTRGAVARLFERLHLKIGINSGRHRDKAFAITELGKMYESIECVIANIKKELEFLLTIKPDFMVTAASLSEEMKVLLPNQITPFFSLNEIDGISYLTMGEENVVKANSFITFLEKFEQADQTLKKIVQLYSQGLECVLSEFKMKTSLAETQNVDDFVNLDFINNSVDIFKKQEEECNKFIFSLERNEELCKKFDIDLGQLMVRQRLALIANDINWIDTENGSEVQVKEHFESLICIKNSIAAFKAQEDKFADLILYLKLPLQEIEEECALLSELYNQIKALPARGIGSRNKDFLEEHPYLLQK